MVAAAVIEVQVCVDDDVDAGEVEVLLAQWIEPGIEVGRRRVQLCHAGVDQHARIGMVDDWLMPVLFGLPPLRFWQAVGLMLLSWILFGSLRGFGMIGGPTRYTTRDGWASLTAEERERFRRGIAQVRVGEADARQAGGQ